MRASRRAGPSIGDATTIPDMTARLVVATDQDAVARGRSGGVPDVVYRRCLPGRETWDC